MQTSYSIHLMVKCKHFFSSVANFPSCIFLSFSSAANLPSSLSLSLSLSLEFSTKTLSSPFCFYSYFILHHKYHYNSHFYRSAAASTTTTTNTNKNNNSSSSSSLVVSEMLSSMGTSHEEEEEDPTDPNYQNQIPLVSNSNSLSGPAIQNTRQLLIRCAELVSQSDLTAAQSLLSLICSNASPYGDSTERLVHQFVGALCFRLNQQHNHPSGRNLSMLSRTGSTATTASISVTTAAITGIIPTTTTATPIPLQHHRMRTDGGRDGDFWVGGGAAAAAAGVAVAQDLNLGLELDWEAVESSYLYLNQITPFIRFSHLTANQAILEATEGQECIHILDFDTRQGLQWPPLMQAIAERHRRSFSSFTSSPREEEAEEPSLNPNPAAFAPMPMIRITGTGQDLSTLRRTGDRLQKFAHSLGLRFHFRPLLIEGSTSSSNSPSWVAAMAAHLPSAIPLMPNEALAVNCVHFLNRLLRDDDTQAARLILRAIRAMNPRVVTVAEREASHNQPFFLQRFVQALDHYTAIFDSLEATLPPNSRERLTVEQVWFGKEILDVVAVEGDQRRQRHEKFETWVELMTSSGFSSLPLSPFALSQAKLLLRLHYPSEGYQLQILNDSFFLGWQDQPLFSVSSWH